MQVIGIRTQLAAFNPILMPALVAIAPDSAVISPAVGKAFKTIEPISPNPLTIDVYFFQHY
jgi:hypothetical protein